MGTIQTKVAIDSLIIKLPSDKRKKFEEEFLDNVEDDVWCKKNNVKYKLDHESYERALKLTYNSLFGETIV
jgi:hypothetical protein